MSDTRKRYKLRCRLPAGQIASASITFFLLTVFTGGLALFYCLFRLGQLLIDHTEVTEAPLGSL